MGSAYQTGAAIYVGSAWCSEGPKNELADLAHRDARTIKPREVIELLDAIVDRPAPVMANRVAGLLSQLFRYGIQRQVVESSPVQLLFRPGGTNGRASAPSMTKSSPPCWELPAALQRLRDDGRVL